MRTKNASDERFLNEKFNVLGTYGQCKKNDNGVYLTQQEIADAVFLSRVAVNQIISDLKDKGYITQDPKHRGRYYLPEKSVEIVNIINQLKYI